MQYNHNYTNNANKGSGKDHTKQLAAVFSRW